MTITTNITAPIKVEFKKYIFEDDFPDTGMRAYLTHAFFSEKDECYKLFFDFTEFFEYNKPLFEEAYYPNKDTRKLGVDKDMYTAIEAGWYSHQYSVFFSISTNNEDDAVFEKEIMNFLKEIV